MLGLSETANERRNRIARELMAQQSAEAQFAYQGHSPMSSFDFAAGYSPAASTAAIGMFDPAGSSPTMQGGAPAPTGRDAFSGTPAQDWGGVFDPSNAPTMTAPDMIASPHAAPTFDVDQTGMPSAPSFDTTPAAPDEQGASLTDPGGFSSGFAAGFSSAVAGMGDIGGMDGMGSGDSSGPGTGGGAGAGNSGGDNTGGSSGVG